MATTPTMVPGKPGTPARQHRASYATDKRNGGYLVRVEGPRAGDFVGREVPVTRLDRSENTEKLVRLIWKGVDKETASPCALYKFEPRPRDNSLNDEILF